MKISAKKLQSYIRQIIKEEFSANNDTSEAENVANSIWGNVFDVMVKSNENYETVYRVTLSGSAGPVKYIKKDRYGKWSRMDPPQTVWRPVTQAQQPEANVQECGCSPECNCDGIDPMKGNVDDLRTMDTANLDESLKSKMTDDQLITMVKTMRVTKQSELMAAIIEELVYRVLYDNNTDEISINEMTDSGAVFSGGPTINTPYAFSKKGFSNKAMDASNKLGYKKAKKAY